MNKRPIILLQKTKMERMFETLSIGCILTAVIYIASVWSKFSMEITEDNAEKMYRSSREMLAVTGFEVSFFLAIAAWGTVQSAFGKDGLGLWYVPLLLIVLFSTIFFHLYKLTKIKSSQ